MLELPALGPAGAGELVPGRGAEALPAVGDENAGAVPVPDVGGHNGEAMKNADAQKALAVLARHLGRDNAISMGELFRVVFGRDCEHSINHTRQVRRVITRLREAGVPVCSRSHPARGGLLPGL
ncbi:MAG: hypothetical protein JRI59_05990 [Deltaproteobacteria bacterium]|nr:hypothetical protein [Deltaproteobacteria bacterium]